MTSTISSLLDELHSAAPLVGPSLLACDFAHLGEEIRRVEDAGARMLHLDIMDGQFVPNLSFGIPVVEAIRRSTQLPLDVHLMIETPQKYVGRFRDAGADMLTVHIETLPDPSEVLEEIRGMGAAAGLSLNPPTDISTVEPYLDLCDLVLVMSVMPGFGGQEFDEVALDKLRRLDELAGERLLLSVDGGVNHDTIGRCTTAGAKILVAGTALFGADDYSQRLEELISLAVNKK
ncbi:MAG: ribulose-phosphate 3-epimerase [Pirellulales bacterium]|nr:ribulose-phosphate 3-epimerase [Pirellulales bacterium]